MAGDTGELARARRGSRLRHMHEGASNHAVKSLFSFDARSGLTMATTQLINPSTFLEPSTVTVVTLLANSNYAIPDYQRDYSWTEEQVRALWDDLVGTATKAYSAGGSLVPNPAPHFLGAVVLQIYPLQSNRIPEVMDGQQRLVTLTALFSVLCEFASQLTQPAERDSWTSSLKQLLFTHLAGNKVPKLTLARDDQHYQELVSNRFSHADRSAYLATVTVLKNSVLARLKMCTDTLYSAASNYVGPVGAAGRDAKLIQLFRTAMELTIVLQMRVMEQGVAYEVFESLNARGLELQQADLLKNKLYALADQQGTKSYVIAAWQRIVKAIEQQSLITLTEFFYFHLVAKYREAKQSELYGEVLAHLSTPGKTARDYAEDAARAAEAIQQILEAGSSFSPAVARDIESIRDLITNKYALVLLLAGASRYPITSAEMGEVIRVTHHYVFRRFIVEGLGVGAYSSEITRTAREFSSSGIADVAALKARLGTHSVQAVFEAKFKEFIAPTNKMGFYVLEMIENYIMAGAGTMVQRQSISQHLEHIMPKRPVQAEWAHVYGDPNYNEYLNRIGNLLVLEANKNSHIKNKSFVFKNANPANLDYQHSGMTLPKDAQLFLDGGQWTFKSIADRQATLVTNYAIVWAL